MPDAALVAGTAMAMRRLCRLTDKSFCFFFQKEALSS
jgi:hypothetical protein